MHHDQFEGYYPRVFDAGAQNCLNTVKSELLFRCLKIFSTSRNVMKTLMESLLYFAKALLSALKNVRPSFGRVCFHHIRIQTELIEALVFVLSEKFH